MQPLNFHRTFSGQDLSSNRIKTSDQYIDCLTADGSVDVYLPPIAAFSGYIDTIKYIFTDISENAATNNIRIFPCPETDDTIEGSSSLTLSDNGKVLTLTIGANRNWNIDGSATSSSSTTVIWVDTTYADLLSLRNAYGLTKGVTYYMTDKRIALQAIATNELSLQGKMLAFVPDYDTYSLWDYAATYSAGEFACFRNVVYQAFNPLTGTPPSAARWTAMTSESYYVQEVHAVEYDMDHEWIIKRTDARNNQVSYSYFSSLMAPTNSNICESFLWGNNSVYGNIIQESYFPLSLMAGSSEFACISNQIINSSFYGKANGTGLMGTFSQNIFENSNIANIVTEKLTWSNCQFINTSIQTLSITQSGIQWNNDKFENSTLSAFTLNSASAQVNKNNYIDSTIGTISLYDSNITFTNNVFKSLTNSGGTTDGFIIEGSFLNFNNNTFDRCAMTNLNIGVDGIAVGVTNNVFTNCSITSLSLLYQGAKIQDSIFDGCSITGFIVGDTGDSVDTSTVSECVFKASTISDFVIKLGSNVSESTFKNLALANILSGEYSILTNCYFEGQFKNITFNDNTSYVNFTCIATVEGTVSFTINNAIRNVYINYNDGTSWDLPAFMALAYNGGVGSVENFSITQGGSNAIVYLDLDDVTVFNAGVLLDNSAVGLGKYTGKVITTATSVKTITSIQTTSMGTNPFTIVPSTNNLSITYVAVAGATAGQPIRDGGAGTVTYVQRTNGSDFVSLQKNGTLVALVASKQYT